MVTVKELISMNSRGVRGHTSELTLALMEEPTIQKWFSKIKRKGMILENPKTRTNCITAMKKYLRFLASGPEERMELTLDEIIEQAKTEDGGEVLHKELERMFFWLMY